MRIRPGIFAAGLGLSFVTTGGTTAIAQTGLTGFVREDANGIPIPDAEVMIEALKRSTKTDAQGKYTLADLSAGVRMVTIRKVGYVPSGFMVQVTDRELKGKDFTLERSTPTLDTMRVQAVPGAFGRAMASFNEHRAKGFGKFIDSTALKARAGASAADFMRDIPGMYVTDPPKCAPMGNRQTNCVNGSSYRVAMTGGVCAMQVRLDGNVIARGGRIDDRFVPAKTSSSNGSGRSIGGESSDPRHDWTSTFDITSVYAATLAAVELYPRETDIPFDLHGPEQECGLLLLWTNR